MVKIEVWPPELNLALSNTFPSPSTKPSPLLPHHNNQRKGHCRQGDCTQATSSMAYVSAYLSQHQTSRAPRSMLAAWTLPSLRL